MGYVTSSLDEKEKLRSKGPDGEKAKENQTTQDLGDQSSMGTGGLESEGYGNSPQANQQSLSTSFYQGNTVGTEGTLPWRSSV